MKQLLFIIPVLLSACQTVEHTGTPKNSGINNPIIRGLIKSESNWNPRAVSKANARGLTQVIPRTAKNICGMTAHELFDPHKSIKCGEIYINRVIARAGNNCAAYSLYNKGEYAKPSCNSYAKKLVSNIAKETKIPFSTVPPDKRSFVSSTFRLANLNHSVANSINDSELTVIISN